MSRRFWRFLAAGVVVLAVLAPAAAWAYPSPSVEPTSQNPVQVKSESTTSSSSLPVTGGDIAGLVALGGGLVVVGVVLRRARGRRLTDV